MDDHSTRRHLRIAARVERVDDQEQGIRRVRAGRGFTYRRSDGGRVDADTVARIRALAVPPAWTAVWICPSPAGHIQATGRDARGRKQYRYHDDWRAGRELAKFGALPGFGAALPTIRARRDRDLRRSDTGLDRVVAGIVLLLERTLIRVGNEEYVRETGHYGLTTLRSSHVRVRRDGAVSFHFVGKSGIEHRAEVRDDRLTRLVVACRGLPGEHLFKGHNGDGHVRAVTSVDVNRYLRETADVDVTAKDFRTWLATVDATAALARLGDPSSARAAARAANEVIDEVASRLGNTRAVCRASYVHPAILQSYADGTLGARWAATIPAKPRGLSGDERRVLAILRRLEHGATRFPRAA